LRSTTRSRTESDSAKERFWTAGFLVAGFVFLWFFLNRPPAGPVEQLTHLEQVQRSGVLRVATVNDPLTYLLDGEYSRGYEYDLTARFAESLNVDLNIVVVTRYSELFDKLERGEVDLAAASISITPERENRVRFGPIYRQVTQQVVYRTGSLRPHRPEDLLDRSIAVLGGSSYAETLRELGLSLPGLEFEESRSGDIESLFEAVSNQTIDLTVADSNVLAIHRRFYPSLSQAFALAEPQSVAWAFPRDDDDSLFGIVTAFFADPATSEFMTTLDDQYFSHVGAYDRINTHYFLRHINSRLTQLRPYFEAAETETGIDWKLLAAMGYQESHWDENAISSTGVRGVMMLTQATARQMGVEDRVDPAQSILGGARYLSRVKAKIPERISEPDRTWLGLAAYNVGFGHLEDARILTQRRGGNPDRWNDVAANLPLLSDREWYTTTRYGYARGREPVHYVRNIRSYLDILSWRMARPSSMNAADVAP
jgi:membrane-bound lytic murein transglycosylase F